MAEDLSRHYEWLLPAERLTLTLEALGRGDEQEIGRLQTSGPRKSYTQADPRYVHRIDAAFDLMAVTCVELRGMMGKLHALEWAKDAYLSACSAHNVVAVLAFVDGVRCAGGLRQTDFFAEPERPESDDARMDDPAEPSLVSEVRGRRLESVQRKAEEFALDGLHAFCHAVDGIAQDLIDSWAAFDRFSIERLGVSAETTLPAWGFPFLEELLATLKKHDKPTPDTERAAELCGCIAANWDRGFGHG
jgi:hypothetical protein